MAYIANRPVRFDRDYAIGEVIPESVIEPTMTKRLVAMGKIICADIPTGNGAGENPVSIENGAEKPTEGGEATDGTNTQDEAENATDGESDGTEGNEEEYPVAGENPVNTEDGADGEEFKCEECGKVFKSANALAAHSRVHNK